MGRLFDERDQLVRTRGELGQQTSTPDRRKAKEFVSKRIADVETQISAISRELGYKEPFYPTRTARKKATGGGFGDAFGSGFDSGFGGGF